MLAKLSLQNFRNYKKREFSLSPTATLIVGPNAIGKTNILEAIYLLATGKSFRAETEKEVIRDEESVARIAGELSGESELEITWDKRSRFQKLYKLNGVGKRQVDFVGNVFAVLFSPLDLELVVNGPAVRRRYLDFVLSQVHKDYRVASHIYERALRQRNRILKGAREQGLGARSIVERLSYWNELLIANGQIIHGRRKDYLQFLTESQNAVFPIALHYDHSTISTERLAKYAEAEIGAAATLVGPHRDDFKVFESFEGKTRDIHLFGSRGEQRLAVLAMKLGELEYLNIQCAMSNGQSQAILLLDDIFSELDPKNRHHVLEIIPQHQTIMTTTDAGLVGVAYLKTVQLVDLDAQP